MSADVLLAVAASVALGAILLVVALVWLTARWMEFDMEGD